MTANLSDLHAKPPTYYRAERLDMLKYIPAGARTTLDFGCASGGFSHLVKQKLGTEAWGVEIDAAAAQEAARKLDRVIHADALESLDRIPDEYFDCILCLDLLEHLVDPYGLLLAVKRKLTSQGVVVASIPNIRYYRMLVKLVVHGEWRYEDQGILDKTHLRFFTRKSMGDTFTQLGYEVLVLEGMHPTSSRTYRILNTLLFHALDDVKYLQYAVVARPMGRGEGPRSLAETQGSSPSRAAGAISRFIIRDAVRCLGTADGPINCPDCRAGAIASVARYRH